MRIGRVYKIIPSQGNECYVGSTFDTLRDRLKYHKYNYESFKLNNFRYLTVFDLFNKYGTNGCKIILIKEYDVLDRRHLEVYETLWMKKLKSINKIEPVAGLLKKDSKKQSNKRYRDENKEEINQKQRQAFAKYKADNREKYLQSKKNSYNKTKEYIICEICDCEVMKRNINRHNQTNKHINNINH